MAQSSEQWKQSSTHMDLSVCLSLSYSSHLQDIKDCRKHKLKEVVLSGIGGKFKPLREAGVLHVDLRRKEKTS